MAEIVEPRHLAVVGELPPRALAAMLSDAARLQAVHSPWASGTPRIEELPSAPGPSPAPRPASVPGVLDASNAAAGALASVLRFEASPARTTSAAEPRQAPRVEATDALELVWFDVESTPRLRRKAAFRAILLALEKKPLDPDFDDPALAKEPMLVEDRREVFEILARAEPTNHAALDATLARCLREDGKFVPAIALFSGELELPFDEVAALRATLSTVTPFVGTDDALRAAVDTARELLALPELIAAPAVVEGLTRRIEDAFAQGKRAVPVGYLEAQRERVLLEQRRYQRRAVFGDKFLRAVLRLDGEATAKQTAAARASANPGVPAYLPPSVADLLPLASRFRARLVAEIRLGADPAESHPAALKVLALVRAVARAPR